MPAARVMRELPLYSFRAISGPVIDQGEGGGDDPEGGKPDVHASEWHAEPAEDDGPRIVAETDRVPGQEEDRHALPDAHSADKCLGGDPLPASQS